MRLRMAALGLSATLAAGLPSGSCRPGGADGGASGARRARRNLRPPGAHLGRRRRGRGLQGGDRRGRQLLDAPGAVDVHHLAGVRAQRRPGRRHHPHVVLARGGLRHLDGGPRAVLRHADGRPRRNPRSGADLARGRLDRELPDAGRCSAGTRCPRRTGTPSSTRRTTRSRASPAAPCSGRRTPPRPCRRAAPGSGGSAPTFPVVPALSRAPTRQSSASPSTGPPPRRSPRCSRLSRTAR